MNSSLTSPGAGGACAVLLCMHLELAYGISPTNSQAAAMASIFSIIFGFSTEIAMAIRDMLIAKIKKEATQ